MSIKRNRYPLLLDMEYPPERRVFDALNSLPKGERAAFIRTLILTGNREMRKLEQQQQQTSQGRNEDGESAS